MKFLTVSALVAGFASSVAHPTLPTMWTSTVKEQGVGVAVSPSISLRRRVLQRQRQVDQLHGWVVSETHFGEIQCGQHEIPLGCDAVDCCYERVRRERERERQRTTNTPLINSGTASPIEYQIPERSSGSGWPRQVLGSGGDHAFRRKHRECGRWEWKFGHPCRTRPTRLLMTTTSILHRWNVTTEGRVSPTTTLTTNLYPRRRLRHLQPLFTSPLKDPRALKCGDAHAKGLLSKKNLEFLHGGNSKLKFEKLEAMIPFLK